MDLVLLVGVGVLAAFAAGGLARRAALGNRMDCSFEALKGMARSDALWDDVVMGPAPVHSDSINAVLGDPSPMVNTQESPADLGLARGRHIPRHARRAS
jgi:hypothetical protein